MLRDPQNTELSTIIPVILAGGEGSRLWPLSTKARPKPFLSLPCGQSLLQKTAARVGDLKSPFVICAAHHRDLVSTQIKAEQLILEPQGKGTAPAIAVAAHYLGRGDDPLMLVLPSDHLIRHPEKLLEAVAQGIAAAKDGWLVTFGIRPNVPSPHYGYIHAKSAIQDNIYEIDRFTEKPDKITAKEYLKQSDYYWNSGIFLFSARTYLENLKAQQMQIHNIALQALKSASRLQNAIFLNEEIFSTCPALSIDYAVMEHAPKRAVIPVSIGWRDLGTWPSLLAALLKR